MSSAPNLSKFNDNVVSKYQIYNSIFMTLPFDSISNTGVLLPLFHDVCKKGFSLGENPTQIVDYFFKKYQENPNEEEKIHLLFRFIQYIERQIELFDAIEDAEKIIEKKVANFYLANNQKKATPAIKSLRNQFEESRLKEINKAKKQLEKGKSIDEILESLSNNLSNKFLHHPTKALNESAASKTKEISDLLKKIYNIKE